jgi:quinohemoprotein ethanol dehydrogenase
VTTALLAWDPVKQKRRWEIRYPDNYLNGGTLTTAGNLVVQGLGRGQLVAYDARTGNKIWSFDAGLGIIGSPIAYKIDDTEYLSILVGYDGSAPGDGKGFDPGWRFGDQPRRMLTFALGGRVSLPPSSPPRFDVRAVDDPGLVIDAKEASTGAELFNTTCAPCHGGDVQSTGSDAPDLRESRLALSWPSFRAVLHKGLLAGAGMPKYDDLTDQDLHALFVYIRARARQQHNFARTAPKLSRNPHQTR